MTILLFDPSSSETSWNSFHSLKLLFLRIHIFDVKNKIYNWNFWSENKYYATIQWLSIKKIYIDSWDMKCIWYFLQHVWAYFIEMIFSIQTALHAYNFYFPRKSRIFRATFLLQKHLWQMHYLTISDIWFNGEKYAEQITKINVNWIVYWRMRLRKRGYILFQCSRNIYTWQVSK